MFGFLWENLSDRFYIERFDCDRNFVCRDCIEVERDNRKLNLSHGNNRDKLNNRKDREDAKFAFEDTRLMIDNLLLIEQQADFQWWCTTTDKLFRARILLTKDSLQWRSKVQKKSPFSPDLNKEFSFELVFIDFNSTNSPIERAKRIIFPTETSKDFLYRFLFVVFLWRKREKRKLHWISLISIVWKTILRSSRDLILLEKKSTLVASWSKVFCQ